MSNYIARLDLDVFLANGAVEVAMAKAKRLLEALKEAEASEGYFVSPYTQEDAITRKVEATHRGTEAAEDIISCLKL